VDRSRPHEHPRGGSSPCSGLCCRCVLGTVATCLDCDGVTGVTTCVGRSPPSHPVCLSPPAGPPPPSSGADRDGGQSPVMSPSPTRTPTGSVYLPLPYCTSPDRPTRSVSCGVWKSNPLRERRHLSTQWEHRTRGSVTAAGRSTAAFGRCRVRALRTCVRARCRCAWVDAGRSRALRRRAFPAWRSGGEAEPDCCIQAETSQSRDPAVD
jgi:hypothetical protein